jgi:DnaJ homolog subfamily C member 13
VVSGVYLRLFVANPGWTLRKPKQFLSDLLDFIVENINRTGVEVKQKIAVSHSKVNFNLKFHLQKDILELSTTALLSLLSAQPNLADSVPVLGHIPKFFRQLSVQPKSALSVLHQLSLSEVSPNF